MPAASFGGDCPLPALGAVFAASDARRQPTKFVHADHGMESSILPYRRQPNFDRVRAPRSFRTVVLENQYLKATFLLDFGGRLWSLYHKPSRTELLDANSIFQPTSVAMRGAWISGGVEWNISIIGHTVFTLDALFAGRLADEDGTPVLRFWEFDRVRQVVFQIDCLLPADSPFLFVRPRIVNARGQTVAMYWWSNIAVKEHADVRVLAPAMDGFRHNYDGTIIPQAVPTNEQGIDITYTARKFYAGDLYYNIPRDRRPWITALDGRGRGLVQASTSRLCGRKLWNWGICPGGRQWQEFLEGKGDPGYIEIQGGLATTQAEYLPMPAGATWEWLEAYGLMEADSATVHGDWTKAVCEVDRKIEAAVPASWMEQELKRTARLADQPPLTILRDGSGWGALEDLRRARQGQSPLSAPGTPFPASSIGEQQSPWVKLLQEGLLPERRPSDDPGSLMVQDDFHRMLEAAVAAGTADHWLAWYHLGIMRARAMDIAGAKAAFTTSIARTPSAWAHRCLGILAQSAEDWNEAISRFGAAIALCPDLPALAIEACQAFESARRLEELPAMLAKLGPTARANPRVRYYEAHARLEAGDMEFVRRFLDERLVMPDVKEGETMQTGLWFVYHEKRIAAETGVARDEALSERVRREFPPPPELEWRVFTRQVSEPTVGKTE